MGNISDDMPEAASSTVKSASAVGTMPKKFKKIGSTSETFSKLPSPKQRPTKGTLKAPRKRV